MYTRPHDVEEAQVRAVLASGWRFGAVDLNYEPVGFGSHHWIAHDADGDGRFVTVDDLEAKRRCEADTSDTLFERLRRTFTAVLALRANADLTFVVAPLVATDGSVLQRLSHRYSLVVHPLIVGRPAGRDGEYGTNADRAAVVDLLVELHSTTAAALPHAVRDDGTLPNRDALRQALGALDHPWETGIYGEPTRHLLGRNAGDVERLIDAYDQLAVQVLGDDGRMVITHGEPHAGNVVMSQGRYLLVDWDTALIAPPERDLWDLDPGDRSILERYRDATGLEVVPEALTFYRLWYDLTEIGGYVSLFRRPHDRTADTAESWNNLLHFLRPRQRWPSLVG